MTTTRRPLNFLDAHLDANTPPTREQRARDRSLLDLCTDTHRADEDEQPSMLDALCACPDLVHDALCPQNPDPSVCDGCSEVYDPDDVLRVADCPGGHCAGEGCLCWACVRGPACCAD